MASEEPALRLSDLQIDDGDKEKEKDKPTRPSVVDQDARDETLRAELAGVQQINAVIERVISSLEKARENMEVSFSPIFLLSCLGEMVNQWEGTVDRFFDCRVGEYAVRLMDSDLEPDGTYSTAIAVGPLGGRYAGLGGH
jgi:hypothetical protein